MYTEIASSEQIVGVLLRVRCLQRINWKSLDIFSQNITVSSQPLRPKCANLQKRIAAMLKKKGFSITILRDNFHLLTRNCHVIANLSKHFVSASERAKGLESDRPRAPDCNGQPQVSSELAFRLD